MKNTWFALGSLLVFPLAVAFADDYKSGGSDHAGEIKWGYRSQHEHGLLPPERWSDVHETCAKGATQSPIDIRLANRQASKAADGAPPETNYRITAMDVFHNRHTVQATDRSGKNFVQFRGARYLLRNIHYHRKSEHLIDGEQFDFELHLVHESEQGTLLVLGVVADLSPRRGTLGDVLGSIAKGVKEKTSRYAPSTVKIDPSHLLPKNRAFATYQGSLTTPPCKEQVRWVVFLEPQGIGVHEQGLLAKKKIDVGFNNFRPHFEATPAHELKFSGQ